MKSPKSTLKCAPLICLFALAACGDPRPETSEETESAGPAADAGNGAATEGGGETTVGSVEIVPGLTMRVLEEGEGPTAQPGQTAVVHYTGWLYDEDALHHRGQKFDSSRDRGEHFEFPIGQGSVIRGWDQGVAGMEVGEVRELTIAPDLAYGERGAGDLIPPDSTLVFEVELVDLED